MSDIVDEIQALKQRQNAVILAHNYVRSEIQDIADFCGDSLELSRKAAEMKAGIVVFCGVRFMAETAKILSPDSMVLLPVSSAGCPMADMASGDSVGKFRSENPDVKLVAYVNSTADVKANVDICCTSGNVEKVLESIPKGQRVMFLPDRNLGFNMNRKMRLNMDVWDGCCPIHNAVRPEMIEDARIKHPGALVLVHPECPPEVVEMSDYALSTGGMLKFIRQSSAHEFIIGTESGIIHRLQKENPDKVFYTLSPELICADMKKITLDDVLMSLKEHREEVILDKDLA